ncbi:hypothetical protein GCM10009608_49030 [Pseudonocardia alaniniphila]
MFSSVLPDQRRSNFSTVHGPDRGVKLHQAHSSEVYTEWCKAFLGGRLLGGLTLGRRISVPVCRAARRGDEEKVTQVPEA